MVTAYELGGTTLKPGTYDSADGTFQITGKLTLDAQGDPDCVFVLRLPPRLKLHQPVMLTSSTVLGFVGPFGRWGVQPY